MFNALFLSDQFIDEVFGLCHPLACILTDRNKMNCITISLSCKEQAYLKVLNYLVFNVLAQVLDIVYII